MKNLRQFCPAAQIKQEGEGATGTGTAGQQRVQTDVMGPGHKRLGRRAEFLAPGVSSFPRKQISHSSVVFWQPVLRPAVQNSEVPGQELAPGLSLARHAKTAPLRQHSTVTALPPHTCNKHVSPHGETCLQTSQVVSKYGT